MKTTVDEIAEDVYRICSFVPDAANDGFTFCQFLIDAEEPLLFHCGPRKMFHDTADAAKKVMALERIRWITFGHVEADECGSLNRWLAAAPDAVVAHGEIGFNVSVADLSDRMPIALTDGQVLDLGGKRVRHIDTPHVPHGWDARLLFEETTSTLFVGDLFTHTGGGPPVRDDDVVERAFATEDALKATALTPATAPTIRRLAALDPTTLAVMHGSSFAGDCQESLIALSEGYEQRLLNALP